MVENSSYKEMQPLKLRGRNKFDEGKWWEEA